MKKPTLEIKIRKGKIAKKCKNMIHLKKELA